MNNHGKILLVTGWRGAGKTSLCKSIINHARQRGWDAAGVLSQAVFENGEKTGIEMVNIRTGETRLLARSTKYADSAVKTTGWAFDPTNMEWGNEIFNHAAPCDLLIVDELGPLELERQQGWVEGLHALDSRKYQIGIAVIRPELLNAAHQRWQTELVVEVPDPQAVEEISLRIINDWVILK